MSIQPIKPDDVSKTKKQIIPDEAIEAFNEIIAEHYYSGQSTFKQDDVVKLMVKKGLKRSDIFDKHWLDVEPIYESAGWKVEYDKPGFNESYPPTFTFTKKR